MTDAALKSIPLIQTNPLKDYIFTSESVSEGHPDKICDQISDAILDAFMAADPQSRVAVETATTTNYVGLIGEVRGPASLTADVMSDIARETIKAIGYEQEDFHWNKVEVDCRVHKQSVDIAQGVDAEGAGDQGIMFGYACRETTALMPAAIQYSHEILKRLADLRHGGQYHTLGPDAKAQVSLDYKEGKPVRASSVVVSTQHDAALSQKDVREMVRPVVEAVLPNGWMPGEEEFYVNPTGRFVIGGPVGDAGLTGRKIIVDTYGGAAPHGGGAFSGKDPTKVDRSASYMARYVAKNIVAAGLAEEAEVQLAYAIGVAEPVSVFVDTRGTSELSSAQLAELVRKHFKLTPAGIIETLDLRRPIYEKSAAYGHFGRELPEFLWERTDKAAALKSDAMAANAG